MSQARTSGSDLILLEGLPRDLQEVLDLKRQGFKQKEIALRLAVCERTVRNRLKTIKELAAKQ
jgi:DNA-binding NarL/FixJ family response regulator